MYIIVVVVVVIFLHLYLQSHLGEGGNPNNTCKWIHWILTLHYTSRCSSTPKFMVYDKAHILHKQQIGLNTVNFPVNMHTHICAQTRESRRGWKANSHKLESETLDMNQSTEVNIHQVMRVLNQMMGQDITNFWDGNSQSWSFPPTQVCFSPLKPLKLRAGRGKHFKLNHQ